MPKQIKQSKQEKRIFITTIWETADVLSCSPHLTNDHADKVLELMEQSTSAFIEAGWATMAECIGSVLCNSN